MVSQDDAATFKRLSPAAYLQRFLDAGVRPDGRALDAARPQAISTGVVSTAAGSALVRIGGSSVVCAVRAEVAEPDLLRPTQGFVVPNMDLPPAAGPSFRPGAPSDAAQIVSDRLRSVLRASAPFPLSALCISPGKAVWALYVDAVCLSFDGTIDAAIAAADAALRDVRLPDVAPDDDGVVRVVSEATRALPARPHVQAATVGRFGAATLRDPDAFEETLCTSHATAVGDATGAVRYVCQVGAGPVALLPGALAAIETRARA